MLPVKKVKIEKQIEKLKADLGKEGYLIGYFNLSPDGQSVNGRFHIQLAGGPANTAGILYEFAKSNPAFAATLDYVEGMRRAARAAQVTQEPKSKLILPKMGVVK